MSRVEARAASRLLQFLLPGIWGNVQMHSPLFTLGSSMAWVLLLSPSCLSRDDDFGGDAKLRPGTVLQTQAVSQVEPQSLPALAQPSRSREETTRSAVPNQTTRAFIAPPSPPTYRGGTPVTTTPAFSETRDPLYRWTARVAQVSPTDIEAHQRPTIPAKVEYRQSSFEETDYRVAQANYQDAMTPPSLPYNSSSSNSTLGSGSSTVMPPNMSAPFNPPAVSTGSTSTGGTRVPSIANPSNLPQYPRSSTAPTFVNGAPFVSGPPCEFDAYGMVSPAAYYAPEAMVCPPGFGYPYAPPGWPSSLSDAYVPPTLTPGAMPGYYTGADVGYRPLFSLGQEGYNVQLGRGIIGQPVAYVHGQPVRNFLRYIFP